MRIEMGTSGFDILDGNIQQSILWGDIVEVSAYKRDLITIDQLCLHLILRHGAEVTVNEDFEGFWDWLTKLETQLGIGAEWRTQVLYPAFRENRQTIYRRGL